MLPGAPARFGRRSLTASALLAAVLASMQPRALAAAPSSAPARPGRLVVRMACAAPEDTPWARHFHGLADRFARESGGRIELELFLAGSRGGETAMARQVAQGSLDLVSVTTGALASLVPELDVLELPFLFSDQAEADRVLDDPEVWSRLERLLAQKGLVPYLWSENGWRSLGTRARPIRRPEDLRGLKMRSQENRVHLQMWRALGALPVPLSTPETLGALETGLVDGFDNTALYAFAASWYRSVEHFTISDHIYQPALLVYNAAWLARQPADLRAVLLGGRGEETARGRALIRKLGVPVLANLERARLHVERLSAPERGAFATATRPVHAWLRERLSAEGKALYELIERKLAVGKPAPR